MSEQHNYKIIPIDEAEIKQYGDTKFNSNNHWYNNEKPEDYYDIILQSHTEKWIDLFGHKYKKITIDNPEYLKLIKLATNVGKITGRIPNIFMEDMEPLFAEMNKYFADNKSYFVRVNNVSLKYGIHGNIQYNNIKNIIESCITSIKGHTPIHEDTEKLDIYLMEWINIEPKNEFRIFVCNNKITAISQQNLFEKLFDENMIAKIPNIINIIIKHFDEEIKPRINWISQYTYDFAIIDNDKPYFIEMNCFGKEYAAGSALFHWLIDENILYGNHEKYNNCLEFRYVA